MGSVLVTGASSGIGAEIVARLDELGHDVYAGVRTERAAEAVRDRSSDRVVPVLVDVTDEEQVRSMGAEVRSRVGRFGLDGLVNNAGIALGGPVEFLPLEEWRNQFEVNVFGQVAVTRQLTSSLRVARGRVVFVGSIGGRVSPPMSAPYHASKFAIAAVAQSLRLELAPWGIQVSLVEPGAVRTPIWDKGAGTIERIRNLIGDEGLELYGSAIDRLTDAIERSARGASGPEQSVDAIERALFDRRARPRYLAGTDARIVAAAVRFLPDRVMDRVLARSTP